MDPSDPQVSSAPETDDADQPHDDDVAGEDAPAPEVSETSFVAKPAEKKIELPDPRSGRKLRLATAAVVQQGMEIEEAAAKHGVKSETLFIWYRTYVNFVGKDLASVNRGSTGDRSEFDRDTARKFDKNWAEMMRIAELERPQLSPLRKSLIASPLTRWLFSGEKVDRLVVAGAGAAILFGALAIKLSTGFAKNTETPIPVKPPPPAIEVDTENLSQAQQKVAIEEIGEALDVITKVESWRELLPHLRNEERILPLMESHYAENEFRPYDKVTIERQISFIKRENGMFAFFRGKLPGESALEDGKIIVFLAELTSDRSKVLFDWEVLVNYQPVPFESFLDEKMVTPTAYRVRVANSDYYNQPFMDRSRFVSYTLYPMGEDHRTIYGFVARDSELGQEMISNLEKQLTGNRAMILKLRFPDDPKFDNIVEIESIVAEGWLTN